MVTKKKLTWNDFELLVDKLVEKLHPVVYNSDRPLTTVYGIPRGGAAIALLLSHKMGMKVIHFPKMDTLIVDDICDTGQTLIHFKKHITAVLHKRPKVPSPGISANHWVEETEDWIVYPWESENTSKVDGTPPLPEILIEDNKVNSDLMGYYSESIRVMDEYFSGFGEDVPMNLVEIWHHGIRGYMCQLVAKVQLLQEDVKRATKMS